MEDLKNSYVFKCHQLNESPFGFSISLFFDEFSNKKFQ